MALENITNNEMKSKINGIVFLGNLIKEKIKLDAQYRNVVLPCQMSIINYIGREKLCKKCEAYCKNSKAAKEVLEKFNDKMMRYRGRN